MVRTDFKPRRIVVALETAKNFITKKFSIDPKDRIAILTFGKTIKKLAPFTNQEGRLFRSMKSSNFSISGQGNLDEALSFGLQLLVEEMRKIGGKQSRILIISDGLKNIKNYQKLEKIVNTANGLGVIIDTFQLGLTKDFRSNTLKRISKITNGEFGFFRNAQAALNAGKAFASKKDTMESTDYLSSNSEDKSAPLLSAIALPLKRLNVLEIRLMMDNEGKEQARCQICHSIKAPLTNADFFTEGRFCPSCGAPMHLSCAALWARKTEYKNNIFRCPFCYFLLKLPPGVVKLVQEYERKSKKIHIIEDIEESTTTMELVPLEETYEINASCSYCKNIFVGKYQVYQCEHCGAYYHEPCLEKMYEEIGACRYCGYSFNM
jgi:hypothetical protein